jgi:uncharacterized protein
MRDALSFIIGLIFGVGLCVSQMTQPLKVQGFLDVAGLWDPSLALVMAGAIAVGLVAFGSAKRREKSLLGDAIEAPPGARVDAKLLIGSALFGVGWGLSGVCPGPAIVNLYAFDPRAVVFFVAMIAGMAIERFGANFSAGERPHRLRLP